MKIYESRSERRAYSPASIRMLEIFSTYAPISSESAGHFTNRTFGSRNMQVKSSRSAKFQQAHIDLFRSFLPQLCYRSPTSSHEAIAKLVGAPNKEFVMEEKLDGERMQLHMRGSGAQWFYCSRKAKDYSKMAIFVY